MQILYSTLLVSALASIATLAAPVPALGGTDLELTARDPQQQLGTFNLRSYHGPSDTEALYARNSGNNDFIVLRNFDNDDEFDLDDRSFKNAVAKGKNFVKKVGKGLAKVEKGLEKVDKYAQIGMKVAKAGMNVASKIHRRDDESDNDYEFVLRDNAFDNESNTVERDLATDDDFELYERGLKSFAKKVSGQIGKAAHGAKTAWNVATGKTKLIDVVMRDVDDDEECEVVLRDLEIGAEIELDDRSFKSAVAKGKNFVKKVGKGLAKVEKGLEKVDKYAKVGMKVAKFGMNVASKIHRRDEENIGEYELTLRDFESTEDDNVPILRDLATGEEIELDERSLKSFYSDQQALQ